MKHVVELVVLFGLNLILAYAAVLFGGWAVIAIRHTDGQVFGRWFLPAVFVIAALATLFTMHVEVRS